MVKKITMHFIYLTLPPKIVQKNQTIPRTYWWYPHISAMFYYAHLYKTKMVSDRVTAAILLHYVLCLLQFHRPLRTTSACFIRKRKLAETCCDWCREKLLPGSLYLGCRSSSPGWSLCKKYFHMTVAIGQSQNSGSRFTWLCAGLLVNRSCGMIHKIVISQSCPQSSIALQCSIMA